MTLQEVKFHLDPSPPDGCIERIIFDNPLVISGNKDYQLIRKYKDGILSQIFLDDGLTSKGSVLPPELLKKYGLENAKYRGRMSEFSIEQFNEKTNSLGGEDYPDEKPYPMQTTICARTIHYWFKVTDLMWEHWVVK
jgi:hypothetical protein